MSIQTELRGLTGARGVAAWFVVLYHIRYGIAGLPDPLLRMFAKGYLAVDFFFLLSGFVIWLAWHDRLRAAGSAGIAVFLQRRVARIWPLHLVMLAFAVALALAMLVTGRDASAEFPWPELPLHIFLVQNWGFTDSLTWNDPAWSISAELSAYLAFPLLVLATDWRRWPTWALIGAAAVVLGILHIVMARAGAPTLGWQIQRFGVLRCLAEFTTGSILCALWLRWRDWRPAPLLTGTVMIATAGLWVAGVAETATVPALFAASLLTLALIDPINPLARRLPHYLGEISYATYLSHFLLFVVFKLVFVTDPRAIPPAYVALYLALVLTASIVLYHGVERPAQRWINRWSPVRAPHWSGARTG
ncbi:Peptidoglycan/LPS O-acetylase OafA/YrhL, contains acyltransferase and SGNH-hydrolase domains [Sphingomonas sp. EC-HK361]|uniref:acyltransferase family protein n=1 Tax=Sphingomonas sp. EC-HK361 TaxID=2038397 RepID=UPI001259A2D9|nr:acyltransferase [Sphingomonas sp. EC-HK361]VVT23640.1 Peptidoglycan/LPS O-acetylase OafA/YrhL, contains acyltransferase and SGNH-hydrolase domains [Sphingomonas sp. EC-HK361]